MRSAASGPGIFLLLCAALACGSPDSAGGGTSAGADGGLGSAGGPGPAASPDGGPPAEGAGPAAPPATPPNFSADLLPALKTNALAFSWTAVERATDYLIEVGSMPGKADLAQLVSALAPLTWPDAPAGKTLYARIRARGAGGVSAASEEIRIASLDLRDAIDALWFGSGPLIPADGFTACVYPRWITFRRDAAVRVRVSSATVSAAAQEAVRSAAQEASALTGIASTFELTSETDPQPADNQITVATHRDPISQGCTYSRGCAIARVRDGKYLLSTRAVLGTEIADAHATGAYPHDALGHGFLGYCHIDGVAIGGAKNSLMSGGPKSFSCEAPSDQCIALGLTALDAAAARAVYGAAVQPGATRADFLAAGLVRGPASGAQAEAAAAKSDRLGRGDEIVVIDL